MYKGEHINYSENVMVVDDVIANLVVLTTIIKKANLIPRPVSSVRQALEAIDLLRPHLILLDISMPEIDGFEFCTMLKENEVTKDIPIIFISSTHSTQDKVRGFKLGAVDFIDKPFVSEEVTHKVNMHLQIYKIKNELELYDRKFQKLVYEQIHKVTENHKTLIYALARLLESRGVTSGEHLENIRANIRILAMSLQLNPRFAHEISDSFIDTIELAASLHDIGKIPINDTILFKLGKLTNEEMDIIKKHAGVGANMLKEIYSYNKQNDFIKMALDIAYFHHEKWNGNGYPKGLAGKDIPLAARIMAVVNMYDFLTSEKCYRPAFTHEESLRIMNEESGISFEPDIIEIFNKIVRQLKTCT